ncbi:hypothetical protein BGZ60DRAFT_542672 [Tricladium varicosporioides]|nr:hypothetical protein BGZ60DRAFT_542672 [Hymenoscyphus varicosporioides]
MATPGRHPRAPRAPTRRARGRDTLTVVPPSRLNEQRDLTPAPRPGPPSAPNPPMQHRAVSPSLVLAPLRYSHSSEPLNYRRLPTLEPDRFRESTSLSFLLDPPRRINPEYITNPRIPDLEPNPYRFVRPGVPLLRAPNDPWTVPHLPVLSDYISTGRPQNASPVFHSVGVGSTGNNPFPTSTTTIKAPHPALSATVKAYKDPTWNAHSTASATRNREAFPTTATAWMPLDGRVKFRVRRDDDGATGFTRLESHARNAQDISKNPIVTLINPDKYKPRNVSNSSGGIPGTMGPVSSSTFGCTARTAYNAALSSASPHTTRTMSNVSSSSNSTARTSSSNPSFSSITKEEDVRADARRSQLRFAKELMRKSIAGRPPRNGGIDDDDDEDGQ